LETFLITIFRYFCQCSCRFWSDFAGRSRIFQNTFCRGKRKSSGGDKSRENGRCSKVVTLCLKMYSLTTNNYYASVLPCGGNLLLRVHHEDVCAFHKPAFSSVRASTFVMCLRPLQHWHRGFESHWRHGCLCVLCAFILCLHSLRWDSQPT
jgi:hypothetical protein